MGFASYEEVAAGSGPYEVSHFGDERDGLLLGDGWFGVQEQIGRTLARTLSDSQRTTVEALTRYLANHSTRLNYRVSLARGEPIGSGLIEGACKQLIGRRMKQTGARWTVPNSNRMAELCSLTYSDQ